MVETSTDCCTHCSAIISGSQPNEAHYHVSLTLATLGSRLPCNSSRRAVLSWTHNTLSRLSSMTCDTYFFQSMLCLHLPVLLPNLLSLTLHSRLSFTDSITPLPVSLPPILIQNTSFEPPALPTSAVSSGKNPSTTTRTFHRHRDGTDSKQNCTGAQARIVRRCCHLECYPRIERKCRS